MSLIDGDKSKLMELFDWSGFHIPISVDILKFLNIDTWPQWVSFNVRLTHDMIDSGLQKCKKLPIFIQMLLKRNWHTEVCCIILMQTTY